MLCTSGAFCTASRIASTTERFDAACDLLLSGARPIHKRRGNPRSWLTIMQRSVATSERAFPSPTARNACPINEPGESSPRTCRESGLRRQSHGLLDEGRVNRCVRACLPLLRLVDSRLETGHVVEGAQVVVWHSRGRAATAPCAVTDLPRCEERCLRHLLGQQQRKVLGRSRPAHLTYIDHQSGVLSLELCYSVLSCGSVGMREDELL
jgi:hypothetical protein